MILSLYSAFCAAMVSFLCCGLIIATQRWHGFLTLDGNEGVQKFHQNPTPRIGGLGIALGLVVGWWVQETEPILQKADQLFGLILFASLPAFWAGILEDCTKQVRVRTRLLATFLSGVLACLLTGYSLTRLDVWGLDLLLGWAPIAIALAAFAVAGVANAYNIVDGFNGLSSSAMLVSLAALVAIGIEVADDELVYIGIIVMAVVVGFLVWNYPFGRIFKGDGGAYLVGFIIAWLAILLPERNPQVSPWASLLACGYPVMETIYSMLRRKIAKKLAGDPDSEHMHSLLKLRVIRRKFAKLSPVLRNSMVMPFLLPFQVFIALTAVFFFRQTPILIGIFLVFFILFSLAHRRLAKVG